MRKYAKSRIVCQERRRHSLWYNLILVTVSNFFTLDRYFVNSDLQYRNDLPQGTWHSISSDESSEFNAESKRDLGAIHKVRR